MGFQVLREMVEVEDQEMKLAQQAVEDDELAAMENDLIAMTDAEIDQKTKLIQSESKMLGRELARLNHDIENKKEQIKANTDKIKLSKTLPYLVGNIVEILELPAEDGEDEGGNVDLDARRQGKSVVLKTSTRQTIFLPVIGLVDAKDLEPGDLVGVNKDSYLVLDKLPVEYDSRVKAMELDERPTEEYSDVGGLDKQIEELMEAVVLPM